MMLLLTSNFSTAGGHTPIFNAGVGKSWGTAELAGIEQLYAKFLGPGEPDLPDGNGSEQGSVGSISGAKINYSNDRLSGFMGYSFPLVDNLIGADEADLSLGYVRSNYRLPDGISIFKDKMSITYEEVTLRAGMFWHLYERNYNGVSVGVSAGSVLNFSSATTRAESALIRVSQYSTHLTPALVSRVWLGMSGFNIQLSADRDFNGQSSIEASLVLVLPF